MKWLYSTTLTLIFLVIFLSKLSPSVIGSVSAGFNLQLSLGLGICGEVVLNLLCAYSIPPFHTVRLKASYQESRCLIYLTKKISRFIDSSLQSAYMLMKWFLMIPLDCQFWQFLLQNHQNSLDHCLDWLHPWLQESVKRFCVRNCVPNLSFLIFKWCF